jgi:hypothetical protein
MHLRAKRGMDRRILRADLRTGAPAFGPCTEGLRDDHTVLACGRCQAVLRGHALGGLLGRLPVGVLRHMRHRARAHVAAVRGDGGGPPGRYVFPGFQPPSVRRNFPKFTHSAVCSTVTPSLAG